MIFDLPRFLNRERPYWAELDAMLTDLDVDPYRRLSVTEIARLQYLYERAVSALGKIGWFSSGCETPDYLQSLAARALAECQPARSTVARFRFWHWLTVTFPQAFRKQSRAFALALALTLAGTALGSAAIAFDHDAKAVLMPFSTLLESPADRVKREESNKGVHLAGAKGTFSAQLITHNIQVALTVFAKGATWGVGSSALLFYNGVTLGAVAADYLQAGYGEFLLAWLLPHGIVEIPAILVAGQAAFVLASALIGWGEQVPRRTRLRLVSSDVLTLAGGAAAMLVWAGLIEAFLSQYHYPVLPYSLKIAFGMVEGAGLTFFLSRSGRV